MGTKFPLWPMLAKPREYILKYKKVKSNDFWKTGTLVSVQYFVRESASSSHLCKVDKDRIGLQYSIACPDWDDTIKIFLVCLNVWFGCSSGCKLYTQPGVNIKILAGKISLTHVFTKYTLHIDFDHNITISFTKRFVSQVLQIYKFQTMVTIYIISKIYISLIFYLASAS